MTRFSILILSLALHTSLSAAPMLRVTGVRDSRTVVVDRAGIATPLTLAGVILPPSDEAAAVHFLNTRVVGAWVLVETDASGGSYLFRSPDGFNVNAAMAQRVYAQGGAAMTYLGQLWPTETKAASSPKGTTKSPAKTTGAHPTRPRLTPMRTKPRGASRVPRP